MTDIAGLDSLPSPALLFDVDRVERNVDRMIDVVDGATERLRPHIKTHKCAEIVALQLEKGVRQLKCATVAEAELAARAGAPDVLLGYPLVGPNAARLARLSKHYPETRFSTLVDCRDGVARLSQAAGATPVRVFLDLDCGQHRTGIAPGEDAVDLVRRVIEDDELEFAGVHAYDGHVHDSSRDARREAFETAMALVDDFLERLDAAGIEAPLVVSGGSPTFPFHAERAAESDRPWQCSPGTTFLWDAGYGENHPDLEFEPAAFLLTRVISRPAEGRLCLDLGHKAVAAENPIERRIRFPDLPEASFVSQSEEHLVIETDRADEFPVGAPLLGIPWHVCPSVALHQSAAVVRDGGVTGEAWLIAARDRVLSV